MRVGDTISGTVRQVAHLAAAAVSVEPISQELPVGVARDGFLERVRALNSNTEVHVPTSLRDRHASILANTLGGIANGRSDGCFLEEIRSKLLLSAVPRGRNRRVELALRLKLWEQQNIMQLLVRIEEQARCKVHKNRVVSSSGARGRRAKYLVLEGARSKAITSLTSELVSLSAEEETQFADLLLPRSSRPDTALSSPLPISEPDENHEIKYSLKGIHFKALSAPGPSGARPEHMRELLATRNKRVSQKLIQSIGRLVDVATKGELPDGARFLLDSRLVFLRKKRGKKPRPIRVGELWRRVVAKRLMHEHRGDVAALCKKARQYGVGFPGGVDVLVHFRIILEKIARMEDFDEAFAILDASFKNMFTSIKWKAIR